MGHICVFLQREDASLPKCSYGLLLGSPSYYSVPVLSLDVFVSAEGQMQSSWGILGVNSSLLPVGSLLPLRVFIYYLPPLFISRSFLKSETPASIELLPNFSDLRCIFNDRYSSSPW